jgi:hypothetical protein
VRRQVGEVGFDELDARDVIQVAAFAGNQVVDDANAMAAAHELFGEMRTDETCAASD